MDKIRPDSSTPPVSQPGSSKSTQTTWSAAGAHLGGRLAAADANMISEVTAPKESSQAQKYASTAIEIFYLLAQLEELYKSDPSNPKIADIWKKLDALKNGPNIFPDLFIVEYEGQKMSFDIKALLETITKPEWKDAAKFQTLWANGRTNPLIPPLVLCAIAVMEYKGSGMDMKLSNTDPNAANMFVQMCLIMASIDTTKGGSDVDSGFWGYVASMGNFADVFPDMLMVYLYNKHIKNDTPEEWAAFQKEFDDTVKLLPKSDANSPNYGKAYNKLQEWTKDSASWESWDDLPVGYSRDFITGDVAYPMWNEWRRQIP